MMILHMMDSMVDQLRNEAAQVKWRDRRCQRVTMLPLKGQMIGNDFSGKRSVTIVPDMPNGDLRALCPTVPRHYDNLSTTPLALGVL